MSQSCSYTILNIIVCLEHTKIKMLKSKVVTIFHQALWLILFIELTISEDNGETRQNKYIICIGGHLNGIFKAGK